MLTLAIHEYVGRFQLLFEHHTIFDGVNYTDAHVTLLGMLFVAAALALGAVIALAGGILQPRVRWLLVAIAPAAVCFVVAGLAGWYVSTFIVNPNRLDRERPYIADSIAFTRQAYGLDRFAQSEFPADTTVAAADPEHNQATLENIRLWDVGALQDTLRQVQEIRTYYDFPGIDIDRYQINGSLRQVMLAVRELNVDKLPEPSRNWINDKLIYTHGYGITMNPVNGFTPEGLPTLYLSNMPVQSTVPGLSVTRPEIYFGEMTNTDVYVKTHQQEFNYPQGQSNNLSSYEGTGGIVMGGFLRRVLLAFDRGDLTKVPFSDDITPESRLLMRRNVLARVQALAPFLTFDRDPYIVVGGDGRLYWIIDAYHLLRQLSLLGAGQPRRPAHQLHAQQREGGRGRLQRNRQVLRLRQCRPDPGRVARHLSGVVHRRLNHAHAAARARSLSRTAAQPAGRCLRPLPYDRPRGFL